MAATVNASIAERPQRSHIGAIDVVVDSMDAKNVVTMADSMPWETLKALTVAQINAAIRKHLDPKKLVMVKAGTFVDK